MTNVSLDVERWAADDVLLLINDALPTSPNAELRGIFLAELKIGTDGHLQSSSALAFGMDKGSI